jgi:hypothetical protein
LDSPTPNRQTSLTSGWCTAFAIVAATLIAEVIAFWTITSVVETTASVRSVAEWLGPFSFHLTRLA